MKFGNIIKTAGICAAAAAGVTAGAAVCRYGTRIRTISSIRQITRSQTLYDLYSMDVKFSYNLDRIIARGFGGEQDSLDSILREALPFLHVHKTPPQFGCSAFTLEKENEMLMGRNYDFKFDTSTMLVHCAPKDGYESIGFAALDDLTINSPFKNISTRLATLTAPFFCLDGVNEKGVSVAVLTLDSKPVQQKTDKPVLSTPLVMRLVLDRAASTQEAVDMLLEYDMYATCGRDYHFYITDATGDGRVIEFDCDDPGRGTVVTPIRQVTNFFVMHKDKVKPNQKNGNYGHGRERYDKIEKILDNAPDNEPAKTTAWQALHAAAQEPNIKDVTSNTQYSIVYDNKNLTADISLRRRWGEVVHVDIHGNIL